jgi:hypothetical protein
MGSLGAPRPRTPPQPSLRAGEGAKAREGGGKNPGVALAPRAPITLELRPAEPVTR